MKRCSKELNSSVGFGIHGLVTKYGLENELYVGSSLVDYYGKSMLLVDAQKVFDEMPVRDVVSWTSLVEAYVNDGGLDRARRVFDEMPKRDHVSWYVMISGYLRKRDFDEAKRLFYEMSCKGLVTYTPKFDGFAKRGSAWLSFNQCWEKDGSFMTALISGYLQNGQSDAAVKCFREMLESISRPHEFKMVELMSACAELKNLHELDSFVMNCSSFDYCKPDVFAALVDMNAKCGNMERANYLFYSWSSNQ